MDLIEQTPYRFLIPQQGAMRVPGIVYASRALLPALSGDRSLEQVVNVATLPGIVEASYAMPDMHWGYGFPIGGVAATDPAIGGVVSPGGVGFDISCGVRLLAAEVDADELKPVLGQVTDRLAAGTPRGAGRGGVWRPAGAGGRRRGRTGGGAGRAGPGAAGGAGTRDRLCPPGPGAGPVRGSLPGAGSELGHLARHRRRDLRHARRPVGL